MPGGEWRGRAVLVDDVEEREAICHRDPGVRSVCIGQIVLPTAHYAGNGCA